MPFVLFAAPFFITRAKSKGANARGNLNTGSTLHFAPDSANAAPSRSFVQFQRVFPAKEFSSLPSG
jgi:hypothetical protein